MNLAQTLLARADDRVAVIVGAASLTRAELARRCDRWRGALVRRGVGEGGRVAVISGNDDVFVTAYLAVIGLGAVAVPLNPQSPPAELGRELSAVEPEVAIVHSAVEAACADAAPSLPLLSVDELETGPAHPAVDVGPDTVAVLLFTSGTAGPSRPAALTHANLDASLRAMLMLPVDLVDAGHVTLGVVPLFHVFGLSTVVDLGLAAGATLVLVDDASPPAVADAVAHHGVTLLGAPPTLWAALAHHPDTGPGQFETIRLALSGAAKLAPAVQREVNERLGLDLREGYGLTETSAVVATSVGTAAPPGSVGRLLPGVEARLVDPSGADVLVGDLGEVWVRGPMVTAGYWAPGGGLVSAVDDDGWLHTGDLGLVDDDGHLAIVDRVKDLVIVSGFNVHPVEVETVLEAHPAVAAAAVVGEPDPDTGERVVAHVVARPGHTLDPDQLRSHCRQQLARYKVPRRIEVRDQLPVGLGGKLRRRDLA
jgi:long-chain acyl-CoA synthetase